MFRIQLFMVDQEIGAGNRERNICSELHVLLQIMAFGFNLNIRVKRSVDLTQTSKVFIQKKQIFCIQKENMACKIEKGKNITLYQKLNQYNFVRQITGVDRKTDGVYGKLDGVSGKMDEVSEKMDGVSRKMDGVCGRIDGISQKINGVSEVTNSVKALKNQQFKLSSQIKLVFLKT